MEGLKNILVHIGGVPTRIWFDNPSTIVIKSLKNGERLLTEAFLRFKNHYGFTAAFCNVNSGHEKGSVETKVGYHRRNLLVPVPQVDDLREFNRHLLEQCDSDMQRPHYRKEAPDQRPVVLRNSVPQMPSCRPRIDHYDRFLKGGRNLETTNC